MAELAAGVIHDVAQGKGGNHRTRGRDLQVQRDRPGSLTAQPAFQLAPLFDAFGHGGDRHLARRDGNLGSGQIAQGGDGVFQRQRPVFGHAVIGGFQKVRDLGHTGQVIEACDQGIAVRRGGDQPDQRQMAIVTQDLDGKAGRRQPFAVQNRHVVDDATGIDHLRRDGDSLEPVRFAGCGAGQLNLQPVRFDVDPAHGFVFQRDANTVGGTGFNRGRRKGCGDDRCHGGQKEGRDQDRNGGQTHQTTCIC